MGLRGIQKTTAFLVKSGFTYPKASRYLGGAPAVIKLRDPEKLCVALNCMPNDLLEWKHDAKTVLPEKHALNALVNNALTGNLRQPVAGLPAERFELIEKLLEELKK